MGTTDCAKVKRALDDLGLEYETHTVSRSRSSREEVHAVSGQYGVPVLVDRGHGVEGLPESDDIVEYLHQTYSDGEYVPPKGVLSRLASRLS